MTATTTSGNWSDAKDGSSYSTNELLPNNDLDGYIDGIRSVDAALTLAGLRAHQPVTLTGSLVPADVCWDAYGGYLVAVGADGGVPDADKISSTWVPVDFTPTALTMTELMCCASNGVDTIVAGGKTSTNSPQKLRMSYQGGAWLNKSVNTTDSAAYVRSLVWFDDAQLFVAAIADVTNQNVVIETSPDGTTWTVRQTPATFTLPGRTKSGAVAVGGGKCLVLPELPAAGEYGIVSSDGVSWEEISIPAQGSHMVAWTQKYGWQGYSKGIYSLGNDTFRSDNGINWENSATATAPTGIDAISLVYSFHSIGNVYLLRWLDASGNQYISASYDGCRTWETIAFDVQGTWIQQASNRWVLLGGANHLLVSNRTIA